MEETLMSPDQRYYEQEAYTADVYDQMNSSERNGEARIPICFCVDTSRSMDKIIAGDWIKVGGTRTVDGQQVISIKQKHGGKPIVSRIDELKRVMKKMLQKLKENSRTRNSASVSIITFDEFAECVMEFRDVEAVSIDRVSYLRTGVDRTSLVRGIQMSLERIDDQNRMNEGFGNHTYRPILVILSDGIPTDRTNDLVEARRTVRERIENNDLYVMPIGIGDFNSDNLRMFSGESRVFNMQSEKDFDAIFDMIEHTVAFISEKLVNEAYDISKGAVQAEEGVIDTSMGVDSQQSWLNFVAYSDADE